MFDNILIVEDLDDNRFFLKSVLEKGRYSVSEAKNGKTALNLFQKTSCDLVFTDIRMPEMDGLTLLRHIKRISPQTPVIIVSAYRDANNVIEALRSGACDYITKPYEEDEITASIARVSRLLEDDTNEAFFKNSLTNESRRYVFTNDPGQTNAMARFLCRDLEKVGLHAEKQLLQVSLIEAINNAIFHGNLEISSRIKDEKNADSFAAFIRLAKQRVEITPYRERKLTVEYSLDEERVAFTLTDDGCGFDYRSLPDPTNPDNFHNPSGRGLLMIRTFCDEVFWNETGNRISLIKYREQKSEKPA